jgi:hypothetical protein
MYVPRGKHRTSELEGIPNIFRVLKPLLNDL